jgi:phosphoribosyl 1,2-cyclic phosphodiesterase
MVLCNLASGSTGNATFLASGQGTLLVDAGITARSLVAALQPLSAPPEDLKAILVTHEHIDHIKAIGPLARKYRIPVYATRGTWTAMDLSGKVGVIPPDCRVVIEPERDFFICGMRVTAHDICHDAAQPVCYTFARGASRLAVATDLGHMTPYLAEKLSGCQTILLESNHDVGMLERNPRYPPMLKRRILGPNGHLCNEDAAQAAVQLFESGAHTFLMGHLSQHNNTSDKAFDCICEAMLRRNLLPGRDVTIAMTWPDRPTALFAV